jgi:hypothetical protein
MIGDPLTERLAERTTHVQYFGTPSEAVNAVVKAPSPVRIRYQIDSAEALALEALKRHLQLQEHHLEPPKDTLFYRKVTSRRNWSVPPHV